VALLTAAGPASTPILMGLVLIGMPIWLGPDARGEMTHVAQLLAAGVGMTMVGASGATLLQATDGAHRVALVQVLGTVAYALLCILVARVHGIVGVAALWFARASIEGVVLLWCANRSTPHPGERAIEGRHWGVVLACNVVSALCAWLMLTSVQVSVQLAVGVVGSTLLLGLCWRSFGNSRDSLVAAWASRGHGR
jgi:O-antigen/teichoic acid export membrane protein